MMSYRIVNLTSSPQSVFEVKALAEFPPHLTPKSVINSPSFDRSCKPRFPSLQLYGGTAASVPLCPGGKVWHRRIDKRQRASTYSKSSPCGSGILSCDSLPMFIQSLPCNHRIFPASGEYGQVFATGLPQRRRLFAKIALARKELRSSAHLQHASSSRLQRFLFVSVWHHSLERIRYIAMLKERHRRA